MATSGATAMRTTTHPSARARGVHSSGLINLRPAQTCMPSQNKTTGR